jgi:hypothetical protein
LTFASPILTHIIGRCRCICGRFSAFSGWVQREILKKRMEAAFQPISEVDPHSDPDHALHSLRDHSGLSLADRVNKIAVRFYLFLAAAPPGSKINEN